MMCKRTTQDLAEGQGGAERLRVNGALQHPAGQLKPGEITRNYEQLWFNLGVNLGFNIVDLIFILI
jgi:hypothetical protein